MNDFFDERVKCNRRVATKMISNWRKIENSDVFLFERRVFDWRIIVARQRLLYRFLLQTTKKFDFSVRFDNDDKNSNSFNKWTWITSLFWSNRWFVWIIFDCESKNTNSKTRRTTVIDYNAQNVIFRCDRIRRSMSNCDDFEVVNTINFVNDIYW